MAEARERPQSMKINHRHQELQKALKDELNHNTNFSTRRRRSTLEAPTSLHTDTRTGLHAYWGREEETDLDGEGFRHVRRNSVRRVPSPPVGSFNQTTSFIEPPSRVTVHAHK